MTAEQQKLLEQMRKVVDERNKAFALLELIANALPAGHHLGHAIRGFLGAH